MNVCLWLTVLEVMQFARDAHMAEGWMIAQEPYLKNENLGVSCFLFFPFFFLSRFYDKFRGSSKNCQVISHQIEKERINCKAFKRQWLLANLRCKLNVSCFSLSVLLDRSQWSRTAFGETRKLRETSKHSRRTIPCVGAPHNGNVWILLVMYGRFNHFIISWSLTLLEKPSNYCNHKNKCRFVCAYTKYQPTILPFWVLNSCCMYLCTIKYLVGKDDFGARDPSNRKSVFCYLVASAKKRGIMLF